MLGVLLSFAVKRGRVFPSLDTIARMAMVSKRNSGHAIAWLGLYGFIDKLRRIVRTSGLLGPRVRQTSNAYVFSFPKGLGGLAVAAFKISPERNNCPPSESNSAAKKLRGSGARSRASRPYSGDAERNPTQKKAGVLILPVMVNDGLPVDFVLDSGASDSLPQKWSKSLCAAKG